MKAMLLERLGDVKSGALPLRLADVPDPIPTANEILIEVRACGVCHTELDEIEGRSPPAKLPIVLGHQVVGEVVDRGPNVESFRIGERVGIAWIFSACGECEYCRREQENLCHGFEATGRDHDGGYAQYMTVPAEFAFRIPSDIPASQVAPLLCAGAVGYRSLRLTNLEDGQRLGLTGFGASAHLVLQMVKHRFPQSEVFVFARSATEREFALSLGAVWAGETSQQSPRALDAIIDTTPAWTPVIEALRNLAPGGRLVINAIRKLEADKSALLELDYAAQLWMEKEIKSVANVTRGDVREFLELAVRSRLRPTIQEYPLSDANRALIDLKEKPVTGSKVLLPW